MAVTMTIRNVPDEVRSELAARAARAGQSLQEYLLAELGRLAAKPDLATWSLEAEATAELLNLDFSLEDLVCRIEEDRP